MSDERVSEVSEREGYVDSVFRSAFQDEQRALGIKGRG